MTYKQYVKEKSTKELCKEYRQIDEAIHIFECFNTKDLALQEAIADELEVRAPKTFENLLISCERKAHNHYNKVRKPTDS